MEAERERDSSWGRWQGPFWRHGNCEVVWTKKSSYLSVICIRGDWICFNIFDDNVTKVKKLIKGSSLNLDNFGEKIEEKLVKITSVEQKSESIFKGLQQRKLFFSSRTNSQPFLSSPIPVNKQDHASSRAWGFLFSRAEAICKNLSISFSSAEAGNSQSRNILAYASCCQRFVFYQISSTVSPSRVPHDFL